MTKIPIHQISIIADPKWEMITLPACRPMFSGRMVIQSMPDTTALAPFLLSPYPGHRCPVTPGAGQDRKRRNEMKYTPGKWTVNGCTIEAETPELNSVGLPYTVCIASIWDERDNTLPDSENDANAHLIAAAPELYEACKTIEGVMYQMSIQSRYEQIWSQLPGGLRKAWFDARAAIAKAEGE